jgi:hypothetical protein
MISSQTKLDSLVIKAFDGRVKQRHNGLFLVTNPETSEGIFITGWIRTLQAYMMETEND